MKVEEIDAILAVELGIPVEDVAEENAQLSLEADELMRRNGFTEYTNGFDEADPGWIEILSPSGVWFIVDRSQIQRNGRLH